MQGAGYFLRRRAIIALIGSLLLWGGIAPVGAQSSPPRLVACTAPAPSPSALLLLPCPQPDPGAPSTTLLGSCPDFASCATLSQYLNTWAWYGVLAFGGLCALWVLWTAVHTTLPVGGGRQQDALRQAGRTFFVACFSFLVAWDLREIFYQLETTLLAAQRDPEALPFQTFVYLGEVVVVSLVQVGAGAVLLSMLLSLLKGAFAFAGGDARALALSGRHLTWMLVLFVIVVAAPGVFSLVAQILTGGR